tara:strand:- start:1823 stop:2083 length:261 start_codon:yes stop_codon:yes gene_type:complete
MISQKELTKRAVKAIGGQEAVASGLGISQQAVSQWISKKGVVPVGHVLHVERLLKEKGSSIDRYDLRPDVYGERPADSNDVSDSAA